MVLYAAVQKCYTHTIPKPSHMKRWLRLQWYFYVAKRYSKKQTKRNYSKKEMLTGALCSRVLLERMDTRRKVEFTARSSAKIWGEDQGFAPIGGPYCMYEGQFYQTPRKFLEESGCTNPTTEPCLCLLIYLYINMYIYIYMFLFAFFFLQSCHGLLKYS